MLPSDSHKEAWGWGARFYELGKRDALDKYIKTNTLEAQDKRQAVNQTTNRKVAGKLLRKLHSSRLMKSRGQARRE